MSLNVKSEVRSVLIANAGVNTIVGTGAAVRIWSRWPRTYTTPCIVMECDSDAEQNDLSGKSLLTISDFTITCRADTDNGARALSDAVRAVLAGYSGTFDAVLDSVADAEVPKAEGSADYFCDRVQSWTMLWNP